MSSSSSSRAPKAAPVAAAKITTVVEGTCRMSFAAEEGNDVFYNPVQVQNRDLSILMLALYGERRQKVQYEQYLAWEEKQRQRRAEAATVAATAPPPVTPVETPAVAETKKSPGSSLRMALSANAGAAVAASKPILTTAERMRLRQAADAPGPATGETVAPKEEATTPPVAAQKQVNDDMNAGPTDIPKVQLHVLDALAASGLRSLRYWKECSQHISHITINDMDAAASERARDALARNDLSDVVVPSEWTQGRPPGIRVTTLDAIHLLYCSRQPRKKGRPHIMATPDTETLTPAEESALQWDVIDLDPYGTAAPFIDAAVQAIAHGGMLNITCTDTRVLSGTHQPELCFNRYGAFPIPKSGYWNEMALRIVLYSIATTAAKYGRSIKPILSVGMDFYVRIFVEVYDNKKECHDVCLNVGHVYQSTQCPSFYTAPLAQMGGENKKTHQPGRLQHGVCTETGGALKIGGPIWLGPLHDQEVLQEALDRLKEDRERRRPTNLEPDMRFLATRERLFGLLTACQQEVPDAPLYYRYTDISKCLHAPPFPLHILMSAIANAGYKVSGYHKEPMAIKTNAPSSVVWDVLRAWVLHRPLDKPPQRGSIAEQILSVPPSFEVSFVQSRVVRETRLQNVAVTRFPMNPEPNWGPKSKATGGKKRKNTPTEEEAQE